MKLFDEMEKCFPEMEKHLMECYEPNEEIFFWLRQENRYDFQLWTIIRFLANENELTTLFRQAGVDTADQMACELIRWFLYDRQTKRTLSREDTLAVQESEYQS